MFKAGVLSSAASSLYLLLETFGKIAAYYEAKSLLNESNSRNVVSARHYLRIVQVDLAHASSCENPLE